MRRFLVDNQLPSAVGRWIIEHGHAADHVLDLNLAQAPDLEIWVQATSTDAVIITKDEDFAQMTLIRPEPVAVVWLRWENCRTAELLAKLEKSWPALMQQLESGARLVEMC